MIGFLPDLLKTFQILLGTFIILTLGFNFNSSWRRYPWDYSMDKFGFRLYFPIITSLGISVALTILLRIISIGIGSSPFN